MKKFFLFAAAIVAAMTVNAKTIRFAGIVDKTAEDAALSTFNAAFDFSNVTIAAAQNSGKTAWYVSVKQTESTTEWDVTSLYLKADDQAYFTFKDANADKEVAKVWADYFQPAGKAACLVVTGISAGDKVTLNLKEALNKQTKIEGATVESDMLNGTAIELTVADGADEIRVYSKDLGEGSEAKEAKWKLVSVEVPGAQAIDNVNAAVKAQKIFENGQLVIIKNGVRYNALGAQL